MKKKIIALCLVVALLAVAIVGGTLAYFTEVESDHNVMEYGKVNIEQLEYQRTDVQSTTADQYGYLPYELEEFTQDKMLFPHTGKDAWETDAQGAEWQQSWFGIGSEGSNQMLGMDNVQDKIVFVENTGTVDAYYRTIIAIEDPEYTTRDDGRPAIMTNVNGNARFTRENVAVDYTDTYKIGDSYYHFIIMTYNEVLTPGQISRPSLLQVYMEDWVTQDQAALFGDKVDILVLSQAVQVAGFEDEGADYALDTAFGEPTMENLVTWMSRVAGIEVDTFEGDYINQDAAPSADVDDNDHNYENQPHANAGVDGDASDVDDYYHSN